MKKNSIFKWGTLFTLAIAMLFAACSKDDPAAPMVTLTETDYNGQTGDIATTTATVSAEAEVTSFRVSKFIGTDIDANYGTNGTMEVSGNSFTLEYELGEEGLEEPIRFNFTAEDENGNTGSADFIVTTEVSLRFLLLNYNWRWHSKVGKILEADPEEEQIIPCEEDNVYTFNEDGTMSIDYGELTGSGGGTCDFDGLRVEERWELDEDSNTLTLFVVNVFDPTDVDEQEYRVTDFSLQAIKSEQTIDLTDFGGVEWDWKFEWRAEPK